MIGSVDFGKLLGMYVFALDPLVALLILSCSRCLSVNEAYQALGVLAVNELIVNNG